MNTGYIVKGWIRRDRENGVETEVTSNYVNMRMEGVYIDIELAMKRASKSNPLTTGFADYYPKQ